MTKTKMGSHFLAQVDSYVGPSITRKPAQCTHTRSEEIFRGMEHLKKVANPYNQRLLTNLKC